jgi:DNA-directed RNA polymerase specialized sigma24 family protein
VARVDVKRAADLYRKGRSLRQIGDEMGVSRTTVSEQLRQAGVTMRRSGPTAHPASTDQILELRDQDQSWTEVAEEVDMTASGAWRRYRRARRPKSPAIATRAGVGASLHVRNDDAND